LEFVVVVVVVAILGKNVVNTKNYRSIKMVM
jgi:hypothetical protein